MNKKNLTSQPYVLLEKINKQKANSKQKTISYKIYYGINKQETRVKNKAVRDRGVSTLHSLIKKGLLEHVTFE